MRAERTKKIGYFIPEMRSAKTNKDTKIKLVCSSDSLTRVKTGETGFCMPKHAYSLWSRRICKQILSILETIQRRNTLSLPPQNRVNKLNCIRKWHDNQKI